MPDDKIEWFTGVVENIGKTEGNKPTKIEMRAKPSDEFAKTLRCFPLAYKEDDNDPDEENEVFAKLREYEGTDDRATVKIKVRKYKTSGGQWRTQNLIVGVWPEGEAPEEEDSGGDWGEDDTKETKSTSKGGGFSQADLAKWADDVIERFIKKLKKEGLLIVSAAALGNGAPDTVAKEVYQDFLQKAEEEGFGEKALQKKFEKLFGDGKIEDASVEQLTGVAEALEIAWT